MVKFKTSKTDATLLDLIARRFYVAHGTDVDAEFQDIQMDITACHCNGNPLRLADLLTADDFNFSHDMFGICRNLDRSTGKLLHCFSPRFSKREVAA